MWTTAVDVDHRDRIVSVRMGIVVAMNFDHWDDDPEYLLDEDPPPPPLSLTPPQRSELADHLGRALHRRECDGTLRAARRWAKAARLPWTPLREELDAHGAYCDCELLDVLFSGDADPTPTST